MTSTLNKLNKLVLSFLKTNSDTENMEEMWMDSSVQKQVKVLCTDKGHEKRKDPNAPKRGKSAYLYFCSDNRAQVIKDLSDEAKATDITKELGVRWNALKESKKSSDKKKMVVYQESAKKDKERYEEEKKHYVPPKYDDYSKKRDNKKPANAPKRAKSAYLYFCGVYRDKVKISNPGLKATEITSQLGAMWNDLKSDSSRVSELKKYEKMASDDKARYEKEKKVPGETVNKSTEKSVDKPKQNGYQAFCAENRPELKKKFPNAKASEITKKLGTSWKALSSSEQEEWK